MIQARGSGRYVSRLVLEDSRNAEELTRLEVEELKTRLAHKEAELARLVQIGELDLTGAWNDLLARKQGWRNELQFLAWLKSPGGKEWMQRWELQEPSGIELFRQKRGALQAQGARA